VSPVVECTTQRPAPFSGPNSDAQLYRALVPTHPPLAHRLWRLLHPILNPTANQRMLNLTLRSTRDQMMPKTTSLRQRPRANLRCSNALRNPIDQLFRMHRAHEAQPGEREYSGGAMLRLPRSRNTVKTFV